MKTTIETAKKQQKLLLPGAPDFQQPRRIRVSGRCSTPSTPEFGHLRIENSTKFNNRYAKKQLVDAHVCSTPPVAGQAAHHSAKTVSFCNVLGLECCTGKGYSPVPRIETGNGSTVEKLKNKCFRTTVYNKLEGGCGFKNHGKNGNF